MVTAVLSSRTALQPTIVPFAHPQGCRAYLIADAAAKVALALDVHLDQVDELARHAARAGWRIEHVLDTHTHADHPSGSAELARRTGARRMAHEKAKHAGVAHHPHDGEELVLGALHARILHTPGHTPDHLVLHVGDALFAGDTLLIGSVARTDFLGGDAGQLFDSLQRLVADLPAATRLFPGHDYQGRTESTLEAERTTNPWLGLTERAEFVRRLTANAPPRPANMDELLRFNQGGLALPGELSAAELVARVRAGDATSVIDVRTELEFDGEHIAGSRSLALSDLATRLDEVRATPAPRLLLCATGQRAALARELLAKLELGGLTVVTGGLAAYTAAGGATEKGRAVMSLERQVRLVAGALVFVSALLAIFVHVGFAALAAFVGAGLVFAALTNTCGMAMVLAKMPWNRRPAQSAVASGGCAASGPAGGCSAS